MQAVTNPVLGTGTPTKVGVFLRLGPARVYSRLPQADPNGCFEQPAGIRHLKDAMWSIGGQCARLS